MNRAFSKILIIGILAVVFSGGFFAWQYFGTPKEGVKDETADWKTYRNEGYGFEFKYSDSLLSLDEQRLDDFFRLALETKDAKSLELSVFKPYPDAIDQCSPAGNFLMIDDKKYEKCEYRVSEGTLMGWYVKIKHKEFEYEFVSDASAFDATLSTFRFLK